MRTEVGGWAVAVSAQGRSRERGARGPVSAQVRLAMSAGPLKADCKEAQAGHCQLVGPQARTLAPGAEAASASHMVDNARADVNLGPHTAKKGAEKHCQRQAPPEHETASVVPGTASASRDHLARDQHWSAEQMSNAAPSEPVRGLGTAIGDRPHDRAMRELGPDQRE